MTVWLYPFERRELWRRRRRAAIGLLAAFLVVLLLDRWLYFALLIEDPGERAAAEQTDFYRTFRVVGTLWPWLLIGVALAAQAVGGLGGRARSAGLAGAAVMTVLSAALSGAAAEVIQVLAGRLRPGRATPPGTHEFRGVLDRFADTSDLAFPSSHAAVAFGGAFLLWFVYRRAGAVALLAAAGCGATRLVSGAHFASDVLGAALLGYAVARLLRPGGWRGLGRPALFP